MGNYEEIQNQRQHHTSHWKSVWQAQGAIISNEGSKPEILSRIAQTTAALSRLKIIWWDKNISLASNVNLVRTLILSTFLYGCKSWTLTAEIERRTQALDLLTMVKKWVLRWYGHNSRSSGMAKTILQGTMKSARRRGRQKKRLEEKSRNWQEWSLEISWGQRKTGNGEEVMLQRHLSASVPRRSPRLWDWDEMSLWQNLMYVVISDLNCDITKPIFLNTNSCVFIS